jgi:hypothetical protein
MKPRRIGIRSRSDRGSALLVSLMVMVGLSLLGLGFVTISETESTISVNERNYAQALSVAEAGARLALEWFQDPDWANTQGLLPPNDNDLKILRSTPAGHFAGYVGYYKSDPVMNTPYGLLFDKPFKPKAQDRFFGDEDHPDVRINATTLALTATPTFLDIFNTAIAADKSNGEVTEIAVYAPPMVGAVLNAGGFWEGGNRYGLATIRVTARKFVGNTVVAERIVKLVVSEWPFPGPQGPVQSNANISTGGNFGVHWGKMTSERNMDIKRPLIGLPWYDPWEKIRFEHGYFANGVNSQGVANDPAVFCASEDWIAKIYSVPIEDPWYEARAKGDIVNIVAGSPDHPFKFNVASGNILNVPQYGYSNWFQHQDIDVPPAPCGARDRKLVIFPKIDYEFWKNLSQSATSTSSSVKYLRFVGGEDYTDGITTQKFAKWVNTARATDPAKPGFYFFDTRNGLNPQGAAPPGILADNIDVNSSDDGMTFMMKGFIYLNTNQFGTTGIRGPGGYFNFPGEPYRDIGHEKVDTATGNYVVPTDIIGENDGEFSCQDLNGNGVCDIFLAQRPSIDVPGTGGTVQLTNQWFPVKYFNTCVPGFNGVAGANCSEPHEPYLNLVYPAQACCQGGGQPDPVVPMWQDPNAYTARPTKKDDATGNPVPCVAGFVNGPTGAGPQVRDPDCTHNGYNRDGALVLNFGGANTEPIMDGVLYNEGDFDTAGNAAYFGSILINRDIIGTGTPEVWFDELLVKGGWQDKFKDLPRVYVSAHETDQ